LVARRCAGKVAAILAEPDRQTLEGQRDHAPLALLYNTGARIQEALDLCPQVVRLESPAQVRLVVKGRKEGVAFTDSASERLALPGSWRLSQHSRKHLKSERKSGRPSIGLRASTTSALRSVSSEA
jgi:site-specific recombinase XerD